MWNTVSFLCGSSPVHIWLSFFFFFFIMFWFRARFGSLTIQCRFPLNRKWSTDTRLHLYTISRIWKLSPVRMIHLFIRIHRFHLAQRQSIISFVQVAKGVITHCTDLEPILIESIKCWMDSTSFHLSFLFSRSDSQFSFCNFASMQTMAKCIKLWICFKLYTISTMQAVWWTMKWWWWCWCGSYIHIWTECLESQRAILRKRIKELKLNDRMCEQFYSFFCCFCRLFQHLSHSHINMWIIMFHLSFSLSSRASVSYWNIGFDMLLLVRKFILMK